MWFKPNRFFLYQTEDGKEFTKAANYYLHEVMKYYENGCKVYYGTPNSHNIEITEFIEPFSGLYRSYEEIFNLITKNIEIEFKQSKN